MKKHLLDFLFGRCWCPRQQQKHLFTFLFFAFSFCKIAAQNVPMAIPYQAVLRNNLGEILKNQNVQIRFAVHQTQAAGTIIYQEKHAVFTANHGLVNVTIGFGMVETGLFADIDWPNGPFFLEVLLNDGTGWKSLGTTQLMSVPFALVAQKVIELPSGGSVDTLNIIRDADKNSRVEVEKYPNEDVIRFTLGGLERWRMQGGMLIPSSSGKSIFIGEEAGSQQLMNTEKENVIIGHHAGKGLTTAFYSTIVGSEAGGNNVLQGESNTFIGAHAGAINAEGYVNTFVGEAAGFANKTGAANTFVGQVAGFLNDNGAYNTYIGRGAGKNSVNGQHNTFLGRSAGLNNVDGQFNVFIGDLAGFFETGGDRQLYIDADTSFHRPLISGHFTDRRVGIDRKATTNTFEVNGEASKSTPGSWLGNSDRRLKTNILSLNSQESLQKMLGLRGVSFEWNDPNLQNIRPKGRQIGFIAQEMQTVFPEMVKTDAAGFLQTSYGTFDPMVVESFRAIVERLDKVEAENRLLIQKNAELEKMSRDLEAIKLKLGIKD